LSVKIYLLGIKAKSSKQFLLIDEKVRAEAFGSAWGKRGFTEE
jgi:hypothetical protein